MVYVTEASLSKERKFINKFYPQEITSEKGGTVQFPKRQKIKWRNTEHAAGYFGDVSQLLQTCRVIEYSSKS
jgi:hypothetical protein